MLAEIRNWAEEIEGLITDVVAKVAPWAAPIPTAFLVGRATVKHLGWPPAVGVVAAVIVESLGLATTATALELREYNQSRRKSDPAAPWGLAAFLVSMYLIVATVLTVLLDIVPELAVFAPAIFPLLSLCGMAVLALRGDHRRRLEVIESVKQERKEKRQMTRQMGRRGSVLGMSGEVSKFGIIDRNLDALRIARQEKKDTRLDALLTFYKDNPGAGVTEAGRAVGVARQTIYNYLDELVEAGRIKRDGDGVEVLDGI